VSDPIRGRSSPVGTTFSTEHRNGRHFLPKREKGTYAKLIYGGEASDTKLWVLSPIRLFMFRRASFFSVFRQLALFSLVICATTALAETRFALPSGSSFSNFAAGNLDGVTENGSELVAATNNGVLTAYLSNGSQLWSQGTPNSNCGGRTNRLHSSPSLADLNGDGIDDVVIGYGGVGSSGCDGGVIAFNGKDGGTLWTFSLKRFAKKEKFGARWHTVFSTPAIDDTDGDGKPEIAFGSFDRNVYLLNSDGSVRWYYNAADTIWSSPAFADIDGDGQLELLAATDISANKRLRPVTKDGGFIYAFKTAAKEKKKRVYFRDSSLYHWQTYVDQVPYSSPVIAEVIPSNTGQELIIASGCFFPQRSRIKKGNAIRIFSLQTGKLLRSLTTQSCSSGSVAVGDLLGTGKKAVVHLSPAGKSGDGLSRLMAFDPDSSSLLWSVVPRSFGKNHSGAGSFQSPIIADVNADGIQEVVLAHGKSILFFDGRNGNIVPCSGTSCTAGELGAGGDVSRATPGLTDLDGDGLLDLLVSASSSPAIVSWKLVGEVFNITPPEALGAPQPEWPAWRGGYHRSGRIRD